MRRRERIVSSLIPVLTALVVVLAGCGEKKTPYDTNLLKNGSFEEVGKDGLPKDWELVVFRGLEGQSEVNYRVDDTVAHEGKNSFNFRADLKTRRWYTLTQEVEVKDATHVRLTGWMQMDQVTLHPDQFAQCNFLLTFYDEQHQRFQEMRSHDKRTRVKQGTRLWFKEDSVFRLPKGTRYVAVSCILGMDGRVWFDDVSLSVPTPTNWEERDTPNFAYHWLPGHKPPEGAIDNQQAIFDNVCQRLGIHSDVVINYYFYPDTTTIRDMLSLRGYQYTSWDDQEFHSINPNDDHEVVHFITEPYGRPPRSIAEGTVFWLYGEVQGMPVRPLAAYLLAHKRLASWNDLTSYNNFAVLDGSISLPSAAALVDYLVSRYGPAQLLNLYKAVNGVNSYGGFAAAFEKVYGIPATQGEQEFQAALAKIDYSEITQRLEEKKQ